MKVLSEDIKMACIVCKTEVDFSVVSEEFESIFERVDYYGEESLTEQDQVAYHGRCCSQGCYDNLR